jgi:hypothetical protein
LWQSSGIVNPIANTVGRKFLLMVAVAVAVAVAVVVAVCGESQTG